ncbi:hypothetical protein [Actinomycetospora termitidis]|uniref:Uncharacterized protein n=1 Tax=Actinomycetospora termitidis TaxID=3053470 RepID=A0ABT7MI06_9PSEU|nr:hypothetical protein [Actinomycetospora sp. Odt1-22]MDL5159567.1 hypothetical protein [Actinomycetospora sp. Odt1-22]
MSGGLGPRWPRRARRLAGVVPRDLPRSLLRPDDDVPALLTRLHAGAVRGRARVHVVQLTEPWACDLGVEMVVAGEFAGDVLRHVEATPDAPPPEPDALTGRVLGTGVEVAGEIVSLRRPSIDGRALAALRGATGAVLVADTKRVRARDLAVAVDMLSGLDIGLLGLVVWEGRIPRDPNWALGGSRRDTPLDAGRPLAALPPAPVVEVAPEPPAVPATPATKPRRRRSPATDSASA